MSLGNTKKVRQTIPMASDLRCEYTVNPIGIDVLRPRFSWILRHSERGRTQSAYRLLVASSREKLHKDTGDMWDSGKVKSDRSVNVEYAGKPLESRTGYYWKVRWWDNTGNLSPFSEPATFETGLLKENEWKAKWIGGGDLLRREFAPDRKVKQARAYICGLGYYELRINGRKVGDHQLEPGWTDYKKVALYVTYDITPYLVDGKNAVGVILGNGRYAQNRRTQPLQSTVPGLTEVPSPRVILILTLEYHGGTSKTIVTDIDWKVSKGPIVENDMYDGEKYDARLEQKGWDLPAYDDSEWKHASVTDPPGGRLVSQATFPPIKAIKTIQPATITTPQPGLYVYDFGQNFAGWARLTVSGARGTEVKLRFAELLCDDGMLNIDTNGGAKATDTYILRGEGVEVYEPRFTYHGFRYVEVTGFPGTPNLDTLRGVVVNSAVEQVGGFVCSNPLINSIHKNIIWGQLSNLMSVPTDCCQRSERLGWMGDAQLTVEEAIHNFDMAGFFTKWVGDIKESQIQDGSVPDVVPPIIIPNYSLYPADPAWGTACMVTPWYVYLYYDDARILAENFEMMKRWVDFLTGIAQEHIVKHTKYGDWCPPIHRRDPYIPGELVSTCMYYSDIVTLSRTARILEKNAEAEQYNQLSEKVRDAFNKEFLKDRGYVKGGQTVNLLPLSLGMVPKDKEQDVLKALLLDVEVVRDSHVGTGIIGARYILDVLTKYGRTDLAYKMVTQTSYPSWGYMIREGATTLWERWEYLTGRAMNSHNHIMFGAIDTWFYQVLAGITTDQTVPGYRKIMIKPYILGELTNVSASVNTVRGLVSSGWSKEGHSLTLKVTLPVNTEGKVSVPLSGLKDPVVKEGTEIVFQNGSFVPNVAGITSAKREERYITFDVGSGSYSFLIDEA